MKLNRTLLLSLCIALACAMAIGGTVAFLSAEDGDVNVMVVGNVKIEQNEYQRVDQKVANSELELFAQGKALLPCVEKEGDQMAAQEVDGWSIQMCDENVIRNYVDKIVNVKNTSSTAAYVRTIFAFPTKGYSPKDTAYAEWLHWNGISDTDTTPDNGWIWGKDEATEWPDSSDTWNAYYGLQINGEEYNVYIATNVDPLASGATTAPSLVGIYMDKRVNSEILEDGTVNYFIEVDGEKKNLGNMDQLEILVLSQAVQAGGFDSAWEAFDAAFPIDDEGEALVAWLTKLVAPQNEEPDAGV